MVGTPHTVRWAGRWVGPGSGGVGQLVQALLGRGAASLSGLGSFGGGAQVEPADHVTAAAAGVAPGQGEWQWVLAVRAENHRDPWKGTCPQPGHTCSKTIWWRRQTSQPLTCNATRCRDGCRPTNLSQSSVV